MAMREEGSVDGVGGDGDGRVSGAVVARARVATSGGIGKGNPRVRDAEMGRMELGSVAKLRSNGSAPIQLRSYDSDPTVVNRRNGDLDAFSKTEGFFFLRKR